MSEYKYKYQILFGSHTQRDEDGKSRTYSAPVNNPMRGDIFLTNSELDKRFNDPRSGSYKFRRVSDTEPCTAGPGAESKALKADSLPDFDRMNVKELLSWAEAEEMSLGLKPNPSKAEVITAIKSHLQPA